MLHVSEFILNSFVLDFSSTLFSQQLNSHNQSSKQFVNPGHYCTVILKVDNVNQQEICRIDIMPRHACSPIHGSFIEVEDNPQSGNAFLYCLDIG